MYYVYIDLPSGSFEMVPVAKRENLLHTIHSMVALATKLNETHAEDDRWDPIEEVKVVRANDMGIDSIYPVR